jgi:hypothetical protein
MDILFAVIGVLIGGGLGYWWRGRSIVRPLPESAVWLFPMVDNGELWRVELHEQHTLLGTEPTLWRLPHHEHSFSLEGKHSLSCQYNERIDVQCVIQVTPKRNKALLESLLEQHTLEKLNDVTWVFQQLRNTLKNSTSILKQGPRELWMDNPTKLAQDWQRRLNESLPEWDCRVLIQHLSQTPDSFYDVDLPEEKANLLKRLQLKEDIAAIELRLQTIELRMTEEIQKQAEFEAKMAQTEQLEVKWTAFENHLAKKRTQIQRSLHESIEEIRLEMRDSLGLLSESLTKEMGVRTPPERLIAAHVEARNTLDSMLDAAKVNHLDLIQEVEIQKVESSVLEQTDIEETDEDTDEETDEETNAKPDNTDIPPNP